LAHISSHTFYLGHSQARLLYRQRCSTAAWWWKWCQISCSGTPHSWNSKSIFVWKAKWSFKCEISNFNC